MKQTKAQKGSALILAIIVIAALLSVGLAGSRNFMTQLGVLRAFSNSEQAFYAAEAGLENGLYNYRSNRNQEVLNKSIMSSPAAQYSFSIFGSKITDTTIAKDLFLDLETRASGTLEMKYGNMGKLKIIKIKSPSGQIEQTYIHEPYPSIIAFDTSTQKIRIHAYEKDAIDISIACVGDTLCIANLESQIFSKSTHAGNFRQLEAKINRQSGLLQSLFDYTLFSQGDIK